MSDLKIQTLTVSNRYNVDTAIGILAVLKIHGELPKDERGHATISIGSLLSQFLPEIHPLLREYVRAFGAHGVQVMEQWLVRSGMSSEAIQLKVAGRYSEFKSNFEV